MDKLHKKTNLIFLIFARECFNLKIRFAKNIKLYRKKLVEALTIVERINEENTSEIRCYIKTSKIKLEHRKNSPAIIHFMNGKTDVVYWYKYGKLHRNDGPAEIWFANGKLWLLEWYSNGKLHRIGKPARLEFYCYFTQIKTVKSWYLNDKQIKIIYQ